ncbi:ty3-gypsy retrotransposon protein [Tanacetum coccineum]
MTKSVQEFVRTCDTCQRYKSFTLSPSGLLQPLLILDSIWEDISIYFIIGLPKSKGYEALLVVVDRLLKYCHFIPLKNPFTSRSLAEVFLTEVIRLHGIPKSVLSDHDPLFLSTFWKEIFSLQGSKLKFSSVVLAQHIFHVSMNITPFEVVYRRAPPTILKYVPGEIHCEAVASDLLDRDEALKQLKYHLARAQECMKKSAVKHQREVEFAIRDWVFLKLRPHRQQSVVRRIHQKLATHFYGPFLIIDKIGEVASKLQLLESARIHPIFHVSLLKQAMANHPVEPILPQGLEIDSSTPSLPELCLVVREVSKKGEKVPQWLIQWQQGGLSDNNQIIMIDQAIMKPALIDIQDTLMFEERCMDMVLSTVKNSRTAYVLSSQCMVYKDGDQVSEEELGENRVNKSTEIIEEMNLVKESSIDGTEYNASNSDVNNDGIIDQFEYSSNNDECNAVNGDNNDEFQFDTSLDFVTTKVCVDGAEFVIFDEEIVAKGSLKWNLTVCGKFVGCWMYENELRNNEGMEDVLAKGTWIVNNKPLFIQKWVLIIRMKEVDATRIPVWAKLMNIPLESWSKEGISALASSLGKPLRMDNVTTQICKDGKGRAEYARVLAELDVNKGIKDEIDVQYRSKDNVIKGTKKVKVEYVWKPVICSHCKVFRHRDEKCKKFQRPIIIKTHENEKNKEHDEDDGFI